MCTWEKYESAYFVDLHRQCKETNIKNLTKFCKILVNIALEWVPCRKHLVETTEIEIAENNGELVQLDEDKTIVNLVLRKV